MKPFSQACENNKQAILDVLKAELQDVRSVLEIGSGTGQHASHFAPALPHLTWQPTDRSENLPGIIAWCEQTAAANLATPIALDVCWSKWPLPLPEALFSANTLHIMGWQEVELFFQKLRIESGARVLIVYGPFNYEGRYTSDSNARFDLWLEQQNSRSGIRDFESVDALAQKAGYTLSQDYEMPANNRTLVWRRPIVWSAKDE